MVDIVELERFAYTPMGTFGRLTFPEFQCFTVERPWLNNVPRESCIPEGDYSMVLGRYNRGGYDCYELEDVPNRTLIKIHRGNTMDDLLGCIAPGKELGFIHHKWAVSRSTEAFSELMEAMDNTQRTTLRIFAYNPHRDSAAP